MLIGHNTKHGQHVDNNDDEDVYGDDEVNGGDASATTLIYNEQLPFQISFTTQVKGNSSYEFNNICFGYLSIYTFPLTFRNSSISFLGIF